MDWMLAMKEREESMIASRFLAQGIERMEMPVTEMWTTPWGTDFKRVEMPILCPERNAELTIANRSLKLRRGFYPLDLCLGVTSI